MMPWLIEYYPLIIVGAILIVIVLIVFSCLVASSFAEDASEDMDRHYGDYR